MKTPFLLAGMSVLEWLAFHTADACVGLAPGIVEGIRRRGPARQPVAMIPNGCDLDLFTPTKRTKISLAGLAPGDFVAGFTGAHGIANGLDAVLDAAAELMRRGRQDIKLVHIGDGKCKPALVARAEREGLTNVRFFGLVKKTEIATLTASFDCGLQVLANVPAFYFGTSPNKFFDYISAGLPVVVNYPGWLAEWVTTAECGFAAAPEQPEEFADALIRLADSPALRARAGRNARTLAEREFGRAGAVEIFAVVLEGAVPRRLRKE